MTVGIRRFAEPGDRPWANSGDHGVGVPSTIMHAGRRRRPMERDSGRNGIVGATRPSVSAQAVGLVHDDGKIQALPCGLK